MWGLPCCAADVSQAAHHFQALQCINTTKQTDSQMDATKAQREKKETIRNLQRIWIVCRKSSLWIKDSDYWDRKATIFSEVGHSSFIVMMENGQVLMRKNRSPLLTHFSKIQAEITGSEQEQVASAMHSQWPFLSKGQPHLGNLLRGSENNLELFVSWNVNCCHVFQCLSVLLKVVIHVILTAR